MTSYRTAIKQDIRGVLNAHLSREYFGKKYGGCTGFVKTANIHFNKEGNLFLVNGGLRITHDNCRHLSKSDPKVFTKCMERTGSTMRVVPMVECKDIKSTW